MTQEIHSAQEAQERASQLPPEVQEMLYSPAMDEIIQKIGQSHNLHIDQIDVLNAETGQVMLGFMDPTDFAASISESLRIDLAQAESIVQDINNLLFIKLRTEMQQKAAQEPVKPVARESESSLPQKNLTASDIVLSQKTVTPPAVETGADTPKQGAPRAYATDPYREPPE